MDGHSHRNEQERIRRCELLRHLRTGGLSDVPDGLLFDPWSDTRPFVKMVAQHDKVLQLFFRGFVCKQNHRSPDRHWDPCWSQSD